MFLAKRSQQHVILFIPPKKNKKVKKVDKQALKVCMVYSDSLDIVKLLSDGMPNITNWRSLSQIRDAWRVNKNCTTEIKVVYYPRKYEFIELAHDLANQGRRCKWDRQGINLPTVIGLWAIDEAKKKKKS